jgi:hypothetical protein
MVENSAFEMNEKKIIVNEQNKTKLQKLCIYSTHAKKICDHEQQKIRKNKAL